MARGGRRKERNILIAHGNTGENIADGSTRFNAAGAGAGKPSGECHEYGNQARKIDARAAAVRCRLFSVGACDVGYEWRWFCFVITEDGPSMFSKVAVSGLSLHGLFAFGGRRHWRDFFCARALSTAFSVLYPSCRHRHRAVHFLFYFQSVPRRVSATRSKNLILWAPISKLPESCPRRCSGERQTMERGRPDPLPQLTVVFSRCQPLPLSWHLCGQRLCGFG
ncbi:hypothetical protein MAPG_02663 [Magnaporthiopsis poae ATCC 64411]|uniref:Uncharacterized protein n=1 Tax=Magnaporthiopsis poae (strain ATCC 64411 / 73-15) TaxID=644358 RepID=A0A0C4DRZ5_MAGP6|nr:hypothetical protein MAPG_02663 [Magnaporthiopsis poae ATCC 64411]